MLNPTEILEQMEDVSTRIAAVAKDFESGTNRFAEVDPYRLAELLGSSPEEFESRTNYGHPVSLDDYCDTIYYYLAPLKGKVTDERIKELEERSEAFERGEVETDAELTPSEKKIIEAALSLQQLEDGGGWVVAYATIESATGTKLEFQAEIGDGGECFGCYSPYQIRDGRGVNVEGLAEGESW